MALAESVLGFALKLPHSYVEQTKCKGEDNRSLRSYLSRARWPTRIRACVVHASGLSLPDAGSPYRTVSAPRGHCIDLCLLLSVCPPRTSAEVSSGPAAAPTAVTLSSRSCGRPLPPPSGLPASNWRQEPRAETRLPAQEPAGCSPRCSARRSAPGVCPKSCCFPRWAPPAPKSCCLARWAASARRPSARSCARLTKCTASLAPRARNTPFVGGGTGRSCCARFIAVRASAVASAAAPYCS